MDDFRKLIESSILTALQNANYLKTTPCTVTSVSDNLATVKLVDNGAEYTLPNWSGSNLVVGENAQLYYKGNIISESTAYIGASLNKDSGGGGGGGGTDVNYIIDALNDLVTTSEPQTIDKSLDMLDELRDLLASVLTEKGIPSSDDEKYNELVDKVSQIETKGSNNEPVEMAVSAALAGDFVMGDIRDGLKLAAKYDFTGEIEQGGYDVHGNNYSSSTYVRIGFQNWTLGDSADIVVPVAESVTKQVQFYFTSFDSSGNMVQNLYPLNSGSVAAIDPSNVATYRLLMKASDDSSITPSDITGLKLCAYKEAE